MSRNIKNVLRLFLCAISGVLLSQAAFAGCVEGCSDLEESVQSHWTKVDSNTFVNRTSGNLHATEVSYELENHKPTQQSIESSIMARQSQIQLKITAMPPRTDFVAPTGQSFRSSDQPRPGAVSR